MNEDQMPMEMTNGTDDSSVPMLLTPTEAAEFCRVLPRTWRTWHAAGRTPQPIRIGRKTFWKPNDLKAWIDAGCPDRATWAIMRQ